MQEALRLAARGRGRVEPNPLVGAVLVKSGKIVGRGWHKRFGKAHAEVNAIAEAGARAKGATLYVTLEPCAHQGKTPPCAEAVLSAGIRRVVAAMEDPHPLVSGKGIRALRRAGLKVDVGCMEDEAKRLNLPFLTLLALGRPYVTAKWAMSLDGKIATASGDSKWITSAPARDAARRMRGLADAVMVGAGTALADNPLLMPLKPRRMPLRIVADSRGRTPVTSALARTAKQGPVMIAVTEAARAVSVKALQAAGCEVWTGPAKDDRLDLSALLQELGRRKMTNLFVEGGGTLLGSLFEAGLVDRVAAFVAPQILGGDKALTPVEGAGAPTVERATRFTWSRGRRVGGDWLLMGEVVRERPRRPVPLPLTLLSPKR